MPRPLRLPAFVAYLNGLVSNGQAGRIDPDDKAIPQTTQEIAARASQVGLPIPPECMDGVRANLALIATHVERMRGGGA